MITPILKQIMIQLVTLLICIPLSTVKVSIPLPFIMYLMKGLYRQISTPWMNAQRPNRQQEQEGRGRRKCITSIALLRNSIPDRQLPFTSERDITQLQASPTLIKRINYKWKLKVYLERVCYLKVEWDVQIKGIRNISKALWLMPLLVRLPHPSNLTNQIVNT